MASALCLAGFFAVGGFHRAGAHWLSMTKSEGNLLLARGFHDIEPGGLCPPAGGSRRSCLHRLESIRNPKLASLVWTAAINLFYVRGGRGGGIDNERIDLAMLYLSHVTDIKR